MTSRKVVIVEGDDDKHVLIHLCKNLNGPWIDEDEVRCYAGVDNLLKTAPARLKASEGDEICAIVVDADDDAVARWQALRNSLVRIGYVGVPEHADPQGTIIDPPPATLLPRVGIWIMPDNTGPGMLETLALEMTHAASPLLQHARSAVESIPASERLFSNTAQPKAIIHTWLAWQEEPGKPLGLAISKRYLNADTIQAKAVVDWLNRLFGS